jgi:hypothetical protein
MNLPISLHSISVAGLRSHSILALLIFHHGYFHLVKGSISFSLLYGWTLCEIDRGFGQNKLKSAAVLSTTKALKLFFCGDLN